MYCSCRAKKYSFTAVWMMISVFLAVCCGHIQAGPKKTPYFQSGAGIADQRTVTDSSFIIDSACRKIFESDFEAARQIVDSATISDNHRLEAIRKVLDEYAAIKTHRKESRDKIYRTQINELEELRQKGFSDDADYIDKIFSVVLKISEFADKKQKQDLLKDPLLIQAVKKAKAKAAEFEAEGKWLDAYTICYSKLIWLYRDNAIYSDHADELLKKADIRTSLQDSPCQTCEDRHAGIEKQMFIEASDVLGSGYVNIIDYRQMAIKGIERCELLVEVMNKLAADNEHKITNVQYSVWLEYLEEIAEEIEQLRTDVDKDEFIDIFNSVLAINESYRMGEALPAELLIAQFSKGAMSGLDPYTTIYWPSQVKDFEKSITNQFSGIGIKFSKKDGLVKIVNVLPDTPAHKSGLQSGDTIIAVSDVETKDISSDCVTKKITGPEGTEVKLTIKRSGQDKARDITLARARITVPSVHGWQQFETGKWRYMIDGTNKIGYIRISGFNSRTADDFENVLSRLEADRLRGLILDLRSNPGGLLDAAVEIADKFIAEGLILRTQPRFGMAKYISANYAGTHDDYPIVVLINQYTASSSEILAGVLQDRKYNRAILVGEKSYGKGSVQSITSHCGNGAKLKYTIAYYHMPSGRRVESRYLMENAGRTDWGILPSVNVELQSNELQEIAKVQRLNESVVTTGRDDAVGDVNRYSSQETIDSDPQMAIGLLVLKSKMIQTDVKQIQHSHISQL